MPNDERTPLKTTAGGALSPGGVANLGAKTIGYFGSIALTVNNISGPGMLEFPAVFQSAGWVPSLVCLVLVCPISSICATLLCDAMARMPGNEAFADRVEFSDIFLHFLGRKWFAATQVAFFLCLLSQNVAAIVSTAQVLDALLANFLVGRTYALQVLPRLEVVGWSDADCSANDVTSCVPFSNDALSGSVLVSEGYLLCALLFVYMGLLNLEENIFMQVVSFVALIAITLVFLAAFLVDGDALADQSPGGSSPSWGDQPERVPAFGEVWRDCLGVVIFNFAFCVTIPSWVNEKKAGTDINTVIWSSTVSSTVLYAAVGWLGGRAFADVVSWLVGWFTYLLVLASK